MYCFGCPWVGLVLWSVDIKCWLYMHVGLNWYKKWFWLKCPFSHALMFFMHTIHTKYVWCSNIFSHFFKTMYVQAIEEIQCRLKERLCSFPNLLVSTQVRGWCHFSSSMSIEYSKDNCSFLIFWDIVVSLYEAYCNCVSVMLKYYTSMVYGYVWDNIRLVMILLCCLMRRLCKLHQ